MRSDVEFLIPKRKMFCGDEKTGDRWPEFLFLHENLSNNILTPLTFRRASFRSMVLDLLRV